MNDRNSGTVLIEVLVALVLVGVVAVGALRVSTGLTQAVERSHLSEERVARADRFLEAVTLWSERELTQRLGVRRQGRWLLEIQRPAEGLYTIQVFDSLGRDTILATAVLRRRGDDAND